MKTIIIQFFQLKCCGIDGPDDWTPTVPSSCCPDNPAVCDKNNATKDGCSQKLIDTVKYDLRNLGSLAVAVAFVKVRTVLEITKKSTKVVHVLYIYTNNRCTNSIMQKIHNVNAKKIVTYIISR